MRMKIAQTSPGLWLTISVSAGIGYMLIGGAPTHYGASNAVALAAVLTMIRFLPAIKTERAAVILSVFAILALGLPLLLDPVLAGVRRWIGVGPVQLHSGMLVLPLLVVLLPRLKSAIAVVVTALAAILITLQPDRASAIALLAGTGALLFVDRSATHFIQLLCACPLAPLLRGPTFWNLCLLLKISCPTHG
jgi:cell division protein FtsW (lipid II flippase)